MSLTLSTSGTAWTAAVMLLAQASIGLFRANRTVLSRSHIVLGAVLLPLTFVHAWLSMKAVPMRSANATGLWLATIAFLLLGVQMLLGTMLIRPSDGLGSLKKAHLAIGLGILFLASVHVLLIGY